MPLLAGAHQLRFMCLRWAKVQRLAQPLNLVPGSAPNNSFKPNTLRYGKCGTNSVPHLLPLRVSA
jgi:hypothetical protein